MNWDAAIWLAILASVVLSWTWIVVVERRRRGQTVTPLAKTGFFATTLAIVIVGAIAGAIAFFATCIPAGFIAIGFGRGLDETLRWAVLISFPPGIAVGHYVGYLVFRWLRRRSRRRNLAK